MEGSQLEQQHAPHAFNRNYSRTARKHGKGQHGLGNVCSRQCNSTTAHCEKTCERPGMDLAMVAVGSVIVQQRTVKEHGKGQHGPGNGGGWQCNSTAAL